MKGRWTIYNEGAHHVVLAGGAPFAVGTYVPVVPCDDAAVERVAAYLRSSSLNDPPTYHGDRRALAEAVLRAAGESP